jgi:glutaconyl-CoA decarboxylase
VTSASFRVRLGQQEFDVTIERADDELLVMLGGERYRARWERGSGALRLLTLGDATREVWVVPAPGGYWVASGGVHAEAEVTDARALRLAAALPRPRAGAERVEIRAPMPGRVGSIRVQPGQSVVRGTVLLTLEAMKMENELRAPQDGVVAEVPVAVGAAVERGALLVVLAGGQAEAPAAE